MFEKVISLKTYWQLYVMTLLIFVFVYAYMVIEQDVFKGTVPVIEYQVSPTTTKEYFVHVYETKGIERASFYNGTFDAANMSIDANIFSPLNIRLSTEAYELIASKINKERMLSEYLGGESYDSLNPRARSLIDRLNPLMIMATTWSEQSAWGDARKASNILAAFNHLSENTLQNFDYRDVKSYAYYQGKLVGTGSLHSDGPLQMNSTKYLHFTNPHTRVDKFNIDQMIDWYYWVNLSEATKTSRMGMHNTVFTNDYEVVYYLSAMHQFTSYAVASASSPTTSGDSWRNFGALANWKDVILKEANLQKILNYADTLYQEKVAQIKDGSKQVMWSLEWGDLYPWMEENLSFNPADYCTTGSWDHQHRLTYSARTIISYRMLENFYNSGNSI